MKITFTAIALAAMLATGGTAYADDVCAHTEEKAARGIAHLVGKGVLQDHKRALHLLIQAAGCGHGEAQLRLAIMYSNGVGVVPNRVLAHMWYNIAAAHNYPGAAENRDLVRAGSSVRRKPAMTLEQVTKAQRMAQTWMAAKPNKCLGGARWPKGIFPGTEITVAQLECYDSNFPAPLPTG